jgi:hypothetical protein
VSDREILEIYMNSGSKNTPETDIFPHATKSLLTSVIKKTHIGRHHFAYRDITFCPEISVRLVTGKYLTLVCLEKKKKT